MPLRAALVRATNNPRCENTNGDREPGGSARAQQQPARPGRCQQHQERYSHPSPSAKGHACAWDVPIGAQQPLSNISSSQVYVWAISPCKDVSRALLLLPSHLGVRLGPADLDLELLSMTFLFS